MANLPRGYIALGEAIALAGAGRATDKILDAGRAVLRQLLIGGAVEAIVMPRRREPRAIPVTLWSTDYAATMFASGTATFADGVGASAGTIEGAVAVPRRALAAALEAMSRRATGDLPAGRAEVLGAFERMCEADLVSFDRGGLSRAAEVLAWSFPNYKAASIANIVRAAYAARGRKGLGSQVRDFVPRLARAKVEPEPRMERWNFYFEPAKAASVGGAAVDLPEGHGIVTFGDEGATERVFFPAGQIEFDLVGGAISRLVREGLAQRYGRLK